MAYFFLLGQTPELSFYELEVVTQRFAETSPLIRIHPHLVSIASLKVSPQEYLNVLGGTVKILQEVTGTIAADFADVAGPDAFVLSGFGQDNLKKLSQTIKEEVVGLGGKARFRISKNPFEGSGIPKEYREYLLIKKGDAEIIAKTIVVQDLNRWNKKDYGRPLVDPKSGMLPPKIARIMVNLAFPFPLRPDLLLLDPFCGSGTIVMESLDLGVPAIGSDLSQKAVESAVNNTQWFKLNFQNTVSNRLFVADAAHLSPKELGGQVDAIVFEGYLGPPVIREEEVKNQYKGMEKLYTGVLKNLAKVLKSGSRLIAALPQFQTKNGVKSLDSLVDGCEKFGYTLVAGPYTYGRSGAKVKRSIYILQKQ